MPDENDLISIGGNEHEGCYLPRSSRMGWMEFYL